MHFGAFRGKNEAFQGTEFLYFFKQAELKGTATDLFYDGTNHRQRVSGAWGLSLLPNLQLSVAVIRNAKLHSDVLSNSFCQFLCTLLLYIIYVINVKKLNSLKSGVMTTW